MQGAGAGCEAWALRGASWALSIGLHGFPAVLGALTLGWQPWAGHVANRDVRRNHPAPTAADPVGHEDER